MRMVKPISGRGTDRRRRVLALVGDTQVGLWVVRSLARNGLTVHAVVRSRHGQAAHSRYAASAWVLESDIQSEAFADEIEGLARELDVGSIMPISEGYHNRLIDLRERFEPGIHIFSPSRSCFDRATDKDKLQELCRELGIPVARGMRLDSLVAGRGVEPLRMPVVLRTRQQNIPGDKAPWKAGYAETAEELQRLYLEVEGYADNVVVQEYHPGVEDHVQILMHGGKAFMAGDYIGEHHMPLAGGVTVQRVSCHHERLVRDAERLLQALDYEGIAGVQFHYDTETDEYIFLEINPRFSGGLPTVIMAGFEAPFLLWQSHFEPERMQRGEYRLGLRTRILGGDANWLLGMLRRDPLPPGQKHLSKASAIGGFLWNSGPWTRDDSFLLRDPKPFLVDVGQMVKKLGAGGHDIIGG
jgi:predicted ATP-grasp superfamily ATP-dependent carboligase